MPVDIGKLVTRRSSEHPAGAFLFEPSVMIPFERAWRDQQLWQQRLFEEPSSPEAVWILQHPACYTLGRGASAQYLSLIHI